MYIYICTRAADSSGILLVNCAVEELCNYGTIIKRHFNFNAIFMSLIYNYKSHYLIRLISFIYPYLLRNDLGEIVTIPLSQSIFRLYTVRRLDQ